MLNVQPRVAYRDDGAYLELATVEGRGWQVLSALESSSRAVPLDQPLGLEEQDVVLATFVVRVRKGDERRVGWFLPGLLEGQGGKHQRLEANTPGLVPALLHALSSQRGSLASVSYTHLTLPTICSV
eukprot:6513483-Prymnesium_polylepis.1